MLRAVSTFEKIMVSFEISRFFPMVPLGTNRQPKVGRLLLLVSLFLGKQNIVSSLRIPRPPLTSHEGIKQGF